MAEFRRHRAGLEALRWGTPSASIVSVVCVG